MNQPVNPPYQPPPAPVQYVQVQAPQTKTAGLAVASMVLGILGFFFGWLYLVIPVLAIIFGGVALRQINARSLNGKGMAVAGLVCGIVSAAIYGAIFIAAIAASNG